MLENVINQKRGMPMFEKLDYDQMVYVYRGLKALIESGIGYGFANSDLGHLAYRAGADGQDSSNVGDSPERNTLFKMLNELSNSLKKQGIENHHFNWWYDFSDWQSFCRFAIIINSKRGGI